MRRRSAATLGAALAAFLFAACEVDRGVGGGSGAGAGPAPVAPGGVAVQVAGWRVDGSGVRPDADPPHEWSLSPRKNVRWEAEVGASYASPILVKDRVFVTAEPDLLLCVARADGKVLWRAKSSFDGLPPEVVAALDDDEKAPPTQAGYATPTPVSDGRRVFVFLGTGIVACYDLEGKREWITHLNRPRGTGEGRTVSPVIVGGKLVVQPSCLVALDPDTGGVLWETPEGKIKCGYGTSVAAKLGETEVLITPSGDVVRASDGRILVQELGKCFYGSPVVRDGVLYFIDSMCNAIALPAKVSDATGKRDFKETWFTSIQGSFFASSVVHGGLVYAVTQDANYFVLEPPAEKPVLEKTLELPPAGGRVGEVNVYPSLTLAGGHLYVSNDVGDTFVLEPGREYKEVARVSVGEGSASTPVFDGGEIFIRGGAKLYCVGK